MMCQCKSLDCNKCAVVVGDVDSYGRLWSWETVGRNGQEALSEPHGARRGFPGRPGEEKHSGQKEQPGQRYRGLLGNHVLLDTRWAVCSGKEP